MTIQILSDLHLEVGNAYDSFEIEPKAPHLALLGDIGNVVAHQHGFLAFLTRQLRQFQTVMLVPGNHEAYHSSWPETLSVLHAFERASSASTDASLGKFVLLDRALLRLPDSNTVVLGCSLFSYVPPESQMAVRACLNDFYQIGKWDVDAHNEMHKRDLAWLNAQVAGLESDDDVRIVIFSHWSPTRDARASDPRHAGSSITSAFSTDLSGEKCFGSGNVKVWAFGHTHYNCDFLVERGNVASGTNADQETGSPPSDQLRILANQRGYYFSQADGFDDGKTIEV